MEERENKRPAGSRPSGSRPSGSRASGRRPSGERPTRERPNGSRPSGKRPSGSRPSNYSKAKKRRPQSKRRRKVYLMVRTTLMIILLLLIVAGVFVWKRYSPSKEQADLNKYYGIKQEGQLAITVNNEVVEPNGRIIDGKAYVQYETVRDHISSRFYFMPLTKVFWMVYNLGLNVL